MARSLSKYLLAYIPFSDLCSVPIANISSYDDLLQWEAKSREVLVGSIYLCSQ